MTTVVVDKREPGKIILCSDNQDTEAAWLAYCQKIFPITEGLNEGDVIATSGDCPASILLINRWEAGNVPDMEMFDDSEVLTLDVGEDFENVLVSDGETYIIGRLFIPVLVDLPYFAIGSGAGYAMGAMAMGADARKAVEVACKLCPYTSKMGRKLQYLEISA